MSLDLKKRRILCDRFDCTEESPLPIVLRGGLADTRLPHGTQSSAAGWVFVVGIHEDRHYCPRCGSILLPQRGQ